MSRSYRKPYYTWTSVRASAREDKMMAARGVRRAQNQTLRDCKDWEELFLPHRRECRHNNVYCWRRDGRQFPFMRSHNDFNLFWLNQYHQQTEEELKESIERDEKFLARLCRK